MHDITAIIQAIQQRVWGVPVLVLLIGVGVYLTLLLRGMQFRYMWQSTKLIFKTDSGTHAKGDISPFQSLMTAMASAVGTGSIVGVATAITAGGVGAIFWLWVTSLITMVIKYAESLLAVKYRHLDARGEMCGGPMYYIEKGLGWKWLAVFFAFSAVIATFGTGNLVQVNSIAEALYSVLNISPWMTGVVLSFLTGFILLKGIKGIGNVAAFMVPTMALFYIAGGLLVIARFSDRLPDAAQLILESAFTGQAAVGGFLGSTVMMAIQMGVARSVFSSEAGLGISSIAAAAARTDSSGRQALIAMTGTLISTAIICTITALAIAVSGVMGSYDQDGRLLNGASLAIAAFEKGIPGGEFIVMIGLVLFAYSTVIAWAYYGEKCAEYLLGEKACVPYRIVYTLIIIPGSVFALEMVWSLADIMNGLMVIPNMIALLALSGIIKKETDDFIRKSKASNWSNYSEASIDDDCAECASCTSTSCNAKKVAAQSQYVQQAPQADNLPS